MHAGSHISLGDRALGLPVFTTSALGLLKEADAGLGVPLLPGQVALEKEASRGAGVGTGVPFEALKGQVIVASDESQLAENENCAGLLLVDLDRPLQSLVCGLQFLGRLCRHRSHDPPLFVGPMAHGIDFHEHLQVHHGLVDLALDRQAVGQVIP